MSSVWVRLHIVREENSKVDPIKIKPVPEDVNDLKVQVKRDLPKIDYASLDEMHVYDTNVNLNDLGNATALDPGDPVPRNTSSKAPLIVTAPPPQQQQQIARNVWYLVTGTIERNRATAGTRYALYRLASGGFYPKGMERTEAFAVGKHPEDETKNLLSISVVFSDQTSAHAFVVKVDEYVVTTVGLAYYNVSQFGVQPLEPNGEPNADDLVLPNHYVANQADGDESPHSPVWDVEMSQMDISALSSTTIISTSNTVFKRQRIEAESAFGRTGPESAHIFPRAKCQGIYKWLDKEPYNRLALSRDAHSNFDGTGSGRGIYAATSALVALEPFTTDVVMSDNGTFKRIWNRLWCGNQSLAASWRPFLEPRIEEVTEGGHTYFHPIYLYCEENKTVRLIFEKEQEPDGSVRDVCLKAIPGVDDPTQLSSWNEAESTVAVWEVMLSLLRWRYDDTRQTWESKH